MAVTSVGEVLNQNLNILIEPNSGSGDSNAELWDWEELIQKF